VTIESIRARVEAATPGPWHRGTFRVHAIFPDGPIGTAGSVAEVRPNVYGGSDVSEMEPQDEGNVAFIAHARQDIPALLAVAEAATAWLRIDPEDDETPEDEWDPRAVALRDALAALEVES